MAERTDCRAVHDGLPKRCSGRYQFASVKHKQRNTWNTAGIPFVLTCFLLLTGVRVADAQCYTFSTSNATLAVDITRLPPPMVSAGGIYQYTTNSGLVANVTLTVSGTTYVPSAAIPVDITITVSSDSGLSFSQFSLNVAFTATNGVTVGALPSLAWNGVYFQNGSLPATLPALSTASALSPPSMIVSVEFVEQTYSLISLGACSALRPTPSAPPSINSGGIVPVGGTEGIIQPGEWVSIYGANLATTAAIWNGDFPTSLAGTSVTVDGKRAYLSYVGPLQINFLSPDDSARGVVLVEVDSAGGTVYSTVSLAQVAPAFLLQSDGKHVAGIILRTDGSGAYGGGTYDIIGPSGASLGYPTVAAKGGDTIALFGTGFGPTDPTVPIGESFSGASATTNTVTLLIGGITVIPEFAGLSSPGLYQINCTVPPGLAKGDTVVVATVAGVQTPRIAIISLQ